MRKGTTLFIVTLVVGLVLSFLGFFLAAPIGSPDGPSISNPRMEFAPLLFVVGIVITFSSAVVYDLVRD